MMLKINALIDTGLLQLDAAGLTKTFAFTLTSTDTSDKLDVVGHQHRFMLSSSNTIVEKYRRYYNVSAADA